MDLVTLVQRARSGDVDAFTALVADHQRLAQGCALALVHDLDVARDVVQEAFIAAWRGLAQLAEPALFSAWLRGIVRRQALHALRARHLEPLAHASEVASEWPSAEQHVESARRRALALAALARLPEGLREPAVLRWVNDCSHAQIAAFLDLPVTTVNNRLHAARVRLKRRMLAMAKDALREPASPDDLPARIGRIVRTGAPVVEVHFEPSGPPELLHTLIAADESGRSVTLEVVQHLAHGRVRCIVRDAEAPPEPGAQVVERGELADAPLTGEALASALDRLVPPALGAPPVLLETGIKVIDVLVPFVRGRSVGIFGGERVGTTVLVEELVRRLATQALSLFTFFPSSTAAGLRHIRDEGYTLGMGGVQTCFFRGDGRVREDAFDSLIVLSPAVAAARLYPAIDPLASRSRWLDPAVVGEAHATIAARVRRCLEEGDVLEGRDDLEPAALATRGRARRLRRFFSQPFFIAEPYTQRPGTFVPRAEALAVCQAIVDGTYDDLREEAFYFAGGIEEILARRYDEATGR